MAPVWPSIDRAEPILAPSLLVRLGFDWAPQKTAGSLTVRKGKIVMMTSDHSNWNSNPQGAQNLHHLVHAAVQNVLGQQGVGNGQGPFGQGAYGQGGFANPFGGGQFATWANWGGQPRQFSQQDLGAILQQIAPILPQIVAQAQQHQPMAAFGGAQFGNQRSLSPQDVNEVVRQILPVLPQLMQSVQQGQTGFAPQGFGQFGGFGQPAYGAAPLQYPGQTYQPHRQLSQQDVTEIARQLAEAIPQAFGSSMNSQRV